MQTSLLSDGGAPVSVVDSSLAVPPATRAAACSVAGASKIDTLFNKTLGDDDDVSEEMDTMHQLAGVPDPHAIHGCGASWRAPLAHFLHNHTFEKCMMLLLLLDVLIVFVELMMLELLVAEEEKELEECENHSGGGTIDVTGGAGHADDTDTSAHSVRRLLAMGFVRATTVVANAMPMWTLSAAGGDTGDGGHENIHVHHHSPLQQFGHALHLVGFSIICVFMLEITLHIVAFGEHFFIIKSLKHDGSDNDAHNAYASGGGGVGHTGAGLTSIATHGDEHGSQEKKKKERRFYIRWMSVVDLIVVPASFCLELLVSGGGSMLAILRLWRIVRVGHGVFMAQSKASEEATKEKEAELKAEVQGVVGEMERSLADKDRRIAELEAKARS
jgi:hypothetical protein